jgi:hypothetical protein
MTRVATVMELRDYHGMSAAVGVFRRPCHIRRTCTSLRASSRR